MQAAEQTLELDERKRQRTLVRFEGNDGFTGPYREIVEAVPDALVAHVQLSRLLNGPGGRV